MDLSRKKILITGAGGFIGSHLTERLVRLGGRVRVFLRYNSRNDRGQLEFIDERLKNKIEYFSGDLKDSEAVRRAVKGCDVVFHLGAIIAIPYSYVNPLDFVQTNVIGTANVLNASLEYRPKKIIITSTSEVYGTALYTPIDEKHPLQGQSPYSASKIAADKLSESYYNSFKLAIAVIRPFNTYGPRQSARAIVPTIIKQLLKGRQVRLGSLFPTRDMNFVGDIVDGFVKIAEVDGSRGEVINIGSGREISIGDLARKIALLLDKKISIIKEPVRVRPDLSEVGQLLADNSKAKEILKWEPNTPLDKGLKITIEWMKRNLWKFKPGEYDI